MASPRVRTTAAGLGWAIGCGEIEGGDYGDSLVISSWQDTIFSPPRYPSHEHLLRLTLAFLLLYLFGTILLWPGGCR